MKALPKYRSHKVVSAAEVVGYNKTEGTVQVRFPDDTMEFVAVPNDFWGRFLVEDRSGNGNHLRPTGYLVIYDNDYISWSPKKAFEEGYSLIADDAENG